MKKILIIGGAGYIGSHVTLDFINRGYEVTVLDDLSHGDKTNLFEESRFILADFLNAETLENALEGQDGVIHMAALKSAGDSMKIPETYSFHNICGMAYLLNSMLKKKVNNLVFSSSAAVYGMPEYLPIDEKHPTKPLNFYGYTKLAGENLMEWYSRLKGIRFASLRYFNAVGYDLEGRILGLENEPNNLFPIIMEVLFGVRKELGIFGNDYDTPDGTCVRDYIHVSDLAKAHSLALEYLFEKKKNLTVNLGSAKGASVKEVVDKALKVFKADFPVVMLKRRPGDPDKLLADSKKAESLLGWKTQINDLEEIIASMYRPYSEKYSKGSNQ